MTETGHCESLKNRPDAENEIHALAGHRDEGRPVITAVATFPPETALAVVTVLAGLVRRGHADPGAKQRDADGIVRAQTFEEGAVYMLAAPFTGFAADRYLMDFYDVRDRNLCSRMHMHTGMRFVRMMTGPATRILVSALTPPQVFHAVGDTGVELESFVDELATDDAPVQPRYNVVVPECAWVDMQIPRGTAHQFNALGPHAVIDTVHPEESIELFRERASRINMMAQTIFLETDQSEADGCALPDR